jgi:hypothetical protein
MDNAWTSKPTFILLSEGRFLIVMIYLLFLHEIMFYFIFVHNYIWILDKAFNIDFCLFELGRSVRQNSVWTMHGRVNRRAHT